MRSIAEYIRPTVAPYVRDLGFDSFARCDFADADLTDASAIIAAAITMGVNTGSEILRFLAERSCRHTDETIEFILNVFEGGDRRYSLWTRDKAGRYSLLA